MIKNKYLSGFFGNFLDVSCKKSLLSAETYSYRWDGTDSWISVVSLSLKSLLFSLILFPSFPPSLSTDDVSSERPLLCNLLPSVGITRLQWYYEVIRLPAAHLTSSIFSWVVILSFERRQALPSWCASLVSSMIGSLTPQCHTVLTMTSCLMLPSAPVKTSASWNN